MPSPFPGMDPYLEHPAFFPDLHDAMIGYLRENLQARLPAPYFAAIGDRVWVEVSDRSIGPDVKVLRSRKRDDSDAGAEGSLPAVATRSRPVVVTVPHDEHREPFLEIYSRVSGERLVAVVEVLSLSNKEPGSHGRNLYLRKQREILASETHLVEIDLLRAGTHTTAAPLDRILMKTGPFDYHVSVHRFDRLEDYFVYPVSLRQPLPEIAVPLLPGDPSVAVDLQAVFERCYDTGPYRRRVRYLEVEPVPTLGERDREWAASILASPRSDS